MRLSTFDRVLLVWILGTVAILAWHHDVKAVTCDNQCRYFKIYAVNAGNGKYYCYNFMNDDCYPCATAGAGGCDNTLALQGGTCQQDATAPQQVASATDCNLTCPLPPAQNIPTQATATLGTVYVAVKGGAYICKKKT